MRKLLQVLIPLGLIASSAFGATLLFVGPTTGLDSRTFDEGVFRYEGANGPLRINDATGNFYVHEGEPPFFGDGTFGVVSIYRNDPPGGTFRLESLDIAAARINDDLRRIPIEGFLNGVSQFTDTLVPALTPDAVSDTNNFQWTTATSAAAAGKPIDMLKIVLNFGGTLKAPASSTLIDNIVLTPISDGGVPEPATVAIMAAGLAMLAILRRAR